MITTSIDSIVHSALMTLQLPLHWYIDGLHYALKCSLEMGYRDLPKIKSARLTIAADRTVALPADYVDWVRIGYEEGQYVTDLGEQRRFNRMAPATGVSYADAFAAVDFFPGNWSYYPSHLTDHNEFNGRFFGQTPRPTNNFLEIRERGLIQLDSSFVAGRTISIDYIYFDAAAATSFVHPYAAPAIEAYVIWKIKEVSRGLEKANRFEARYSRDEYYAALKQWRSQAIGLTLKDIERAIRSGSHQTPKI